MALRHSTAFQKKILDGGSTGGVGPPWGTTGQIKSYTGAQPTTADTAPTGTLLANNAMNGTAGYGSSNTPAAASTAGSTITMNAVSTATAGNTGTAGYARQQLAADAGTTNNTDVRLDYLYGGEATIDNSAVVSGGVVNVTAGSYNQPM